ncbi:MAG: MerR family transcriptional regulator [Deltaproteobacteria bacterium]|nr:MerR family transcriptional regulator [Deltaproteobacteria bacterium]MBM4316770.1 MerR family transcriptional regulator [Deltaproteobacteria bacterium]
MSDSRDFELPQPYEKLSHKFILDSIKLEKKIIETEIREPQTIEKTSQCGTQAELPIDIEQEPHESIPMEDLNLDESKKYFRIGEVSALIGVEPYVLRYWESEFSFIRPTKAGSGHRVYSKKDVEALHIIRHLLHVEKYSIKGAKKKFNARKKEVRESQQVSKHQLKAISSEIKELIQLIKTF